MHLSAVPGTAQAGTFTLPSGIETVLVDPPSPWLRRTGMTGVDEDLLTNRRLMKNGEGM